MVERVDRYVCARVCACGVCICVVGPPGGVQAFVGGWSETQKVRIRGVCVWMCGCVCVWLAYLDAYSPLSVVGVRPRKSV